MTTLGRVLGFAATLIFVSACGGGGGGSGDSGGGTLPTSFTVSTSTTGTGSGSLSPASMTVSRGSTASFTISPAASSTVASVSGCGGSLSGTTYTTGAISSSCTVTASFMPSGTTPPPPVVTPPPNRAPSISGFVSSGNPSEAGQAVTFSWTTQDPDGDTLRCTFDPTGSGPVYEIANCAGQASVTHTYENRGTFPARLEVSDGALEASSTLNQRVTSDFMVTVLAPRANALVDTTLRVEARVTSPLEVSSVSAVMAGRSAALTFSPANFPWDEARFIGTLSLAGLSRGEQRLDVTARDINDRTTTATLVVIYDQRPTISIAEPLDYSVSDGALRLRASCTDDDPAGCTVRVLLDSTSTVIASAENALNEDVDLGDYDGRWLTLRFEARDSANQVTSEGRVVYIETSAALTRVADLQGPVLDINGTRILYRVRVRGEDGDTLRIFDRANGSSQTVPLPAGKRVSDTRSFLTPYGAIFTSQDGSGVLSARTYDWNSGQLNDLGRPNSASSLEVAGDYAIWSDDTRLTLRNLATRTNAVVSNNAGNWRNDVAENGAVAFWNLGSDIELYRDGSSTVLTNDLEVWNTGVVTDGTRVVYRKHTHQGSAITLHDGTQEIELSPAVSVEPSPGRNFQIVPGWVAYTAIGNLGQRHVWLYGPAGTRQQLTFFGISSTIELLAESGAVMLANERRYHAATDGMLTEVSSTLGRPFFIGDRWFIAIGRSVFEWAGVP